MSLENGNRPGEGAADSVGNVEAAEATRPPAHSQALTLAEHADAIRALGKRVVADVVEIGRRLAHCRDILKEDGSWRAWLESELRWSPQTAGRFIQVYALSRGCSNLEHLELPVSALYMLAAPSTPVEARDEIIARAQAGEQIPLATIRETIETARRGIVTGVAMHPYAERGHDLYETPPPVTRALLSVESFDGATIWEPANGRGAISRVLRAAGHRVVATDLVDYGVEGARGGVDFLTQTAAPEGVTTILTNPPFMHANEFVRRALTLVPRVAFFLRLAFIASVGRADILDCGKLARIHVFANRPTLHRDGWDVSRMNGGAIDYAWFIWDRNHRGPIELRRIWWEAESDEARLPHDELPPLSLNGGSAA